MNLQKHIASLLSKTNNLIQRHMILSFFKKYAAFRDDLKNDLKKFPEAKKFFVAKEEVEERAKERKLQGLPYVQEDWYEETYDLEEFYVYQDPPLGVSDVLYGKCFIIELLRNGYDDPVCLAGVYPVDKNGNIVGDIMGRKVYEEIYIEDCVTKIIDQGIKGYGRLYMGGDRQYTNFNDLKNYVKQQIEKRNKQIQYEQPK